MLPHEGSFTDSQGRTTSMCLPLEDDPEVFGLHPNAKVTFEQKTVREFMETILMIQPRISGGKAAKT